jgi:hypothetical protein
MNLPKNDTFIKMIEMKGHKVIIHYSDILKVFIATLALAYESRRSSPSVLVMDTSPDLPGYSKGVNFEENTFKMDSIKEELLLKSEVRVKLSSGCDYEGSWNENEVIISSRSILDLLEDISRFGKVVSISSMDCSILRRGLLLK